MKSAYVSSGINGVDSMVQGLRLGDNVVWQVETLEDYMHYAQAFISQGLKDGAKCVYVRFAPHKQVLVPHPQIQRLEVDPGAGFDAFTAGINRVVEQGGLEVRYVFDNLSALVEEWATDELLANFFQVVCPYLYELDTVAYFALGRHQHVQSAVARIRATTQVLLDVFHVGNSRYIHPLKVWQRYTPQMFLPHLRAGETYSPVFQSGNAAAVLAAANRSPLSVLSRSTAPWDSIYQRLLQCTVNGADETQSEVQSLKQEYARILLGSDGKIDQLAVQHLTVEDVISIRERLIGSGRIGGKAAGMILARKILLDSNEGFDFSQILEGHDSFFIGSDVFFSFLVRNQLFRLRTQFSKQETISWDKFTKMEEKFLAGDFPQDVLGQFENMLEYYGQAPIIVRSSSLLEDGFGNAFAGKYRSEFCVNQGSPQERLDAFLRAVKLVYASTLNPDAIAYRRKRGLLDKDEQMAILVQRVSGTPYRNMFFPALAGVAFSSNLYPWSSRIDPNQGLVRLVFGLGTRAVDRVETDYPRMFAVSHPMLRPEFDLEVVKYAQWQVDVLNLETNQVETLPVPTVIGDGDYPQLGLFTSVLKDGYVSDMVLRTSKGKKVLTFNNLLSKTPFAAVIGTMLQTIQAGYGHPVDTEFTASVEEDQQLRINLLQCRPLTLPSGDGLVPAKLPEVPESQVLFRASRIMGAGSIAAIRYVVYIDPKAYSAAALERKKQLGRWVGRLNDIFARTQEVFILMGPGRWGSSSIDLGVRVSYADINHVAALIEIAREQDGHVPEVSYGTHFFQDLVEDGIIYMPVYPAALESQFNEAFFAQSPNCLVEVLPEAADYRQELCVIDLEKAVPGNRLQIQTQPVQQQGICFFSFPRGEKNSICG